jgi:hypothetical protein
VYKDRKLNDLFIEFAKDMGWEKEFVPTSKHNRYYAPVVDNAGYIQSNWKEFKSWLKQRKSNGYILDRFEDIADREDVGPEF